MAPRARQGIRGATVAHVVLLSLIASGGCGDAAAPSELIVQDSAGVRILTHRGVAPTVIDVTGTPAWTLSDTDDGALTLYDVVGAVLATDGGLIIANAGHHEVLRLSSDGEVVWRVGREGDGPEEFRSLAWLQGAGEDTVTVWDGRGRRASALDPSGRFSWTRTFPETLDVTRLPADGVYVPSPAVLAAHGDGTMLGYPGAIALPRGRPGPLPLEADFRAYPADPDAPATRLGRRTVITWYEDPSREGSPIANALGSPRMWWGAHSGRMAYTSALRHEIEVFDGERATLVIREDRPRVPFTPDSIPAAYDLAVDSLPAYEQLAVDGLHRIWARTDRARNPATWRLWDPSGGWIADVLLPVDARVMDAGVDRLVLRRTDALDVERIEVHRFEVP